MKMIYSILIATCLLGCEQFPMDKRYRIFLNNNSDQNVACYLGYKYDVGAEYPDTTFPKIDTSIKFTDTKNKFQKIVAYDGSGTIEDVFKALSGDTLSIFIFNADTLQKYPWDTVRGKYMILQRYDLSQQDLKNRKNIIEFPYDSTKGKLKVWPK